MHGVAMANSPISGMAVYSHLSLACTGLSSGTVLSSVTAPLPLEGDSFTCVAGKGSKLPPGAGELRSEEGKELEGVMN